MGLRFFNQNLWVPPIRGRADSGKDWNRRLIKGNKRLIWSNFSMTLFNWMLNQILIRRSADESVSCILWRTPDTSYVKDTQNYTDSTPRSLEGTWVGRVGRATVWLKMQKGGRGGLGEKGVWFVYFYCSSFLWNPSGWCVCVWVRARVCVCQV